MIARIELKDGTVLKGNKYINEMLQRVQFVFGDFGVEVAVITSGVDGNMAPTRTMRRNAPLMCVRGMSPKINASTLPFHYANGSHHFTTLYEPAVMKDGKIVTLPP